MKTGEKIYVIIDEYDHFANELLGFNFNSFNNLVTENGKVRKWYEILKKGTESVVDRIFITGVAPITLDSLTSGFNIADDITKDIRFNQMMGFTKEEFDINIDPKYAEIALEMLQTGEVQRIIDVVADYLSALSNRDYQRFDEKYVKVIFFTIIRTINAAYNIISERETNRKYTDLLLLPKDKKYT